MKIVLCITGASGVIYGFKTLESLIRKSIEVSLVISKSGYEVISEELHLKKNDPAILTNLIDKKSSKIIKKYKIDDLTAPFASGSTDYDACLIVPCSMSTLAKIANGITDNLITRTADVFLKERRKLIILVRETPLNLIHIENMKKIATAGAIVMPACPAFYTKPESIDDILNFIVGRILDQIQIRDHELYKPYKHE